LAPYLVPLDALMASYRAYAHEIGDRGRKSDESMIGKMLVEIFGDALGKRARITAIKFEWNSDGTSYATFTRVYVRRFPSLAEARRLFLGFYKAEHHVDWFDDENADAGGKNENIEWNIRHEQRK
jgi:hypothetical protein